MAVIADMGLYSDPFGWMRAREQERMYKMLCCKLSSAISGAVVTYTFDIGTDVPAGNTVSSPLLKNVVIHSIVLDNSPLMISQIPYTTIDPGDSNNGLLDFTSIGGVSNGSILEVTVTAAP